MYCNNINTYVPSRKGKWFQIIQKTNWKEKCIKTGAVSEDFRRKGFIDATNSTNLTGNRLRFIGHCCAQFSPTVECICGLQKVFLSILLKVFRRRAIFFSPKTTIDRKTKTKSQF